MEVLDIATRAYLGPSSNDPLPPDVAAQDKGPSIMATIISLAAIMTFFVAARLYTRMRVLGSTQLDDYLIIASTICLWVATGLNVAANEHGAGRHVRALTMQQLHDAKFYTMTAFIPSLMSFGVPKLAIVALLTRITNPGRFHRIFLWCLAGSCFAALCLTMVILFSMCNPVSYLWDPDVPPELRRSRCWDPRINVYFAYFSGSYSAFVDLYLAVYPTVVLFKLQMSWKQKLALSSALGLGGVASFVAIYKCTRLPSLASEDYTYDTADLVTWTSIESNTLIIATCIPILKPLIDRIFGRRLLGGGRTMRGYAYHRNSYGAGRSSTEPKPSGVSQASRPENPVGSGGASGRRSKNNNKRDLESSLTDPDDHVAVTVRGLSDSQESILGLESTVRSAAAHHHSTNSKGSAHINKNNRTGSNQSLHHATASVAATSGVGVRTTASRSRGLTTASVGTGGAVEAAGEGPGAVGLAVLPPAGAIMRTDIVTVSYDARSQRSEDDGERDAGSAASNPGLWRPRHF